MPTTTSTMTFPFGHSVVTITCTSKASIMHLSSLINSSPFAAQGRLAILSILRRQGKEKAPADNSITFILLFAPDRIPCATMPYTLSGKEKLLQCTRKCKEMQATRSLPTNPVMLLPDSDFPSYPKCFLSLPPGAKSIATLPPVEVQISTTQKQ